ncbi:MAG: SIMPL domain-containing protein [Ichthyobacteriaceae bacterium]|nr:SIMPL domain-containing protein [Ichthyobacteriaceae bacterium]
MKNIKLIILLVTLLNVTSYAQHKTLNTLSVTGKGTLNTKPDIANINFNLNITNTDFQKAINELNTKTNKLTDALKKAGIKKDEIYTSNYSIVKDYQRNYKTGDNKFKGYRVSHQINIKTKAETKDINKVFSAVTSSINEVELSLSFAIGDKDGSENKLISLAIKDAKAKAKLIATESGVKLLKIKQIQLNNSSIPYRSAQNQMHLSKNMLAESAPAMVNNFNPSNIKQNTTVSIVWIIE